MREETHHRANGDTAPGSLSRLLEPGGFTIAYQPIVDLSTGTIVACEALVRPTPASGFANPGAIFEAAASQGRTWEVESALRQASLDQASNWDPTVRVFLNCSPQVFIDERFAASVLEQARAAHIDPSRVTLEVTETIDAASDECLAPQVGALTSAGFSVAIDDVGAGTSGLSRLIALRPGWLKLDRNLIKSIHADELRKNLVRFFVHFARLSGVRVVAEGVETFEELAAVAALGVRFTQGFYFVRPAGADVVLSAPTREHIASICAEVAWSVPGASGDEGLRRLIRPAQAAQGSLFISDAAALLMRQPTLDGLVIFDGRRARGWCPRDLVLEAARTPHRRLLETLIDESPGVIGLRTPMNEAVELLCARPDAELSAPLVVLDRSDLVGVIHVRDLLRTLALRGQRGTTMDMLVGWAGRAAADQFIEELLAQGSHDTSRQSHEAMIIDIEGLADFNAAYGYDLGDVVIKTLADAISSRFDAAHPGAFCAHLGDDRFLVITRQTGIRDELSHIVRAFETGTARLMDGPGASPALFAAARRGLKLRLLLIPRLLERIGSPRELAAIERQLRDKIRRGGNVQHVGSATLVIDDRTPPRESARRVA